MTTHEIIDMLEESPDLFLALSLSAPAAIPGDSITDRQFSVELVSGDFVFRTPIDRAPKARETQLLCSKESIASAVLLYAAWRQRIVDSAAPASAPVEVTERDLVGAILEHARGLGRASVHPRSFLRLDAAHVDPGVPIASLLNVPDSVISEVDERCHVIFQTLERKGWAVDPGFTVAPEIMVLLGLMPMQWSVRTPEGERIYREIRINAPMWSLSVDRYREGRRKWNNWQFNLRGINFVRGLLRQFAEQFLVSEEQSRIAEGYSTLPLPKSITLDNSAAFAATKPGNGIDRRVN